MNANWVETIVHAGRVVTERQLAKHLFSKARHPKLAARQAIAVAEKKRWVQTDWMMLHPELDLVTQGPIVDWQPEGDTPDFQQVSWKLKSRWRNPPERTRLVFPESAVPSRGSERLHDVHVAELYFSLGQPHTWTGEDDLRGSFDSSFRPDATIESENGQIVCLDFGGSYSPSKVNSIHQQYLAASMPYQIY